MICHLENDAQESLCVSLAVVKIEASQEKDSSRNSKIPAVGCERVNALAEPSSVHAPASPGNSFLA